MKKIIIMTPLVLLALLTGCIEDYDLELDEVPPRLVVEGLITNEPGPYFIRLSESFNGKLPAYSYDSIRQNYFYTSEILQVTDALVIVSDNAGQVDTLIPANAGDYRPGGYTLINNYSGSSYDTVWFQSDPQYFTGDRGLYKTNSLVGVPGRTYSLKIVHREKVYEAHAYMPPVPEIDSLGAIIKREDYFIGDHLQPLIYFAEPQETKDYYLIQMFAEPAGRLWSYTVYYGDYWDIARWPFSLLSDEHLQPYVNGLPVNGGTSRDEYGRTYTMGLWNGDMYVRLSSLTREAYQYYKVLTEQFENSDGGAFHPAPASAPTNISSGGLGFFRASAVAVKHKIVGWRDGITPLEVSTAEVTGITATTAVSNIELNIPAMGGYLYGICWSTEPNPEVDDFVAYDGDYNPYAMPPNSIPGNPDTYYNLHGNPTEMTNLVPGTKYYVRAFIETAPYYNTVFYGNQREFTTLPE